MAQTTEQFHQALNLVQQDAAPLWPDFTPARTPFLVFDGQDSWLLQADPPFPDGWHRRAGHWRFPGRHPQLQANTAILLSELPHKLTPRELAAFAVHEAFHVYQELHPSPAWEADELSALTYPIGDEQVLVTRAMETDALYRALKAEGDGHDWAAVALGWRQQRFALLSEAHQAYERALERVEGLAHHAELRFLNELPGLEQPDVPAEQVRRRTYTVGAAYAALLDRLKTDWPTEVQDRGVPLDLLLASALGPREEPTAVPESIRGWAQEEARGVQRRQEEALAAFEARPGTRLTLTVATGAEPSGRKGSTP